MHKKNNIFSLFIFQNGYPARRRSLVDDARFETLVVKQTKQSVLEEARQRANGMIQFKLILIFYIYILCTLHDKYKNS